MLHHMHCTHPEFCLIILYMHFCGVAPELGGGVSLQHWRLYQMRENRPKKKHPKRGFNGIRKRHPK